MTARSGGAVRLTTSGEAARAFNRLRGRLVRNHARTLLSVSRLRLLTIVCCSGVFWTGLFGLFFEGFRFLDSYVETTNEIVEYVFSMFFLSLLIMLIFSTAIILYAGLFQSREAAFLLTTPAPTPLCWRAPSRIVPCACNTCARTKMSGSRRAPPW